MQTTSTCVNSLKTVNAEIITLSTQTMKKLKCTLSQCTTAHCHSFYPWEKNVDLKKWCCPGIWVFHLGILFCSCRCWFRQSGPLEASKIFNILSAKSCTSGLHPFLCLKFLMKVGTGWAETGGDHVSLTAELFSGALYPGAGKDWLFYS